MSERDNNEDGFTLVELMVVVLVISILIAIAIPAYRGAMQRAGERRAQTHLRNAAVAAKTITNDLGFYVAETGMPLSVTDLEAAEGSVRFTTDPLQASTRTIVMVVDDDPVDPSVDPYTRLHLYLISEPGRWFGLTTTTRGKFLYCEGDTATAVNDPDACVREEW